jgi:nucleoside-diphosphate-sugar epimerase
MVAPTFNNPTIPVGSLILVTGVNGLIGSHAADQILKAGYRVRGAVRNAEKNKWLVKLFDASKFQLVEVPDLAAPNAWDQAIEGVAGIAHTAGPVDVFVTDVDTALAEEMKMQTVLLEAAKKTPSVKAFAQTGSAWAVYTPKRNTPMKLTEWSFNEEAIGLAYSDAPQEQKGWAGFMALKTRLEQEIWTWIKREKPDFTFNTILLDTVIGRCVDPENQGYPSTAGFLKGLFHGQFLNIVGAMEPQWFIDTADTGKLYLAALITPGCNGERLFGFGGRYSWPLVTQIFKEIAPNNKNLVILDDAGSDMAEVPNQRAEELIRGVGASGWTSLKTTVKENVQEFL